MTVEELVRFSIDQNERHFQKLDRDISKLQREGTDTRKMAARAVTTAKETKTRVDTIVLGGFRAHSTAEERKTELAHILRLFPDELTEQIATKIIPEPRANIVLLQIYHHDKGTPKNPEENASLVQTSPNHEAPKKIGDEPLRTSTPPHPSPCI